MTPDQINARIAYEVAYERHRVAEHGTVTRKRKAMEKAANEVVKADLAAKREERSAA